MKMDADSSGTEHRDSRGSRSRSWREREHHGRTRERDSRKKEHKIPYFADEVREQDRIRRLRQRAHQSTRRTRSRSRSQSSDRGSRHRRHRQRSRSRNRSRSRSSERRRRQRSPDRYNPPPKIINYYVQVPPQDFYGMSGMQQSFGYQRLPRPPPFPPAPFRYRQRQPFMGAPRFGYRNAGRPPY
uniref:Female-specific protein transformer n=1 Tax=Drosophila mauritiana TaxID=7226 RepID=Q86LR3_DROMA|nr:transformer [Drosophila mauritiana]